MCDCVCMCVYDCVFASRSVVVSARACACRCVGLGPDEDCL